MLFNSLIFLCFMAVVLPLYYALQHRWQNKMLVIASYLFYGAWDWRFLFLLLISTLVDFNCARAMSSAPERQRKLLLYVSLASNLGILGFFKYFNFFVDSAATLLTTFGFEPNLPTLSIILPVGISFYTFQTLAYTIDVYRRKQDAHDDIIDFALYVSYFPQLVAGPIERSQRLLSQIARPRTITRAAISSGIQLIIMGYLKKVAIADSVAPYVNSAFSDPSGHSSIYLLISLYMFALQIYGDFSGYSDIARGVSRLLGIELMINFRQPYLASNITEFWRRWHISLSSWLRDYLYIPLGGNRNGSFATYRNLMITMLLGGLWHGASWNFVIWGALHGIYLSLHKLIAPIHPREGRIRTLLGILFTFHLVCLTWIFFRAETFDIAWQYLTGLLSNGVFLDFALRAPVAAFYLTLMLGLDFLCWRGKRELPIAPDKHPILRGLLWGTALILILYVGEPNGSPFIYFQF